MDLVKITTLVLNTLPPEIRPDMTEFIKNGESFIENPVISEWKGHRFRPPTSAQAVEWQYNNWTPKRDDVLVASFPKTGTTWMREIVRHLLNRDDEKRMKLTKLITPVFAYLEGGLPVKFEVIEKLPLGRFIFGTHLPANLLNMERIRKFGCKIIYTIRNPKDQLVSWNNVALNYPCLNGKSFENIFPRDWDGFFETFIKGKQPLAMKEGEWYPDHILTWYPHRNDDNVRFVMYEDMKKDPQKEIRGVADFLGVNISDDEISQVVTDTSFNKMKQASDATEKKLNLFRKGQVGDWKNHFTVAQSELMDQKFNEKLSHISDIKFTYDLPNC